MVTQRDSSLRLALGEAISALREIVTDPDQPAIARVAAAGRIESLYARLVRDRELDERLAALERGQRQPVTGNTPELPAGPPEPEHGEP